MRDMEKEKEKNINLLVQFIWRCIFKWTKNGKGKWYYPNGSILFEGEYLNGQRNGKGKEFNKCQNGEIIFEGEFLYNFKLKGNYL